LWSNPNTEVIQLPNLSEGTINGHNVDSLLPRKGKPECAHQQQK